MRTLTIKSTRNETEALTFTWPEYPPTKIGNLGGSVVVVVENGAFPNITKPEITWLLEKKQEKFFDGIKKHQELKRELARFDRNQLREPIAPDSEINRAILATMERLREHSKHSAQVNYCFDDICRLLNWLRVAPLKIVYEVQRAPSIPSAPPLADVQDEPPSYDEALALPKN